MKSFTIAAAALATLLASSAFGATYELRRIAVTGNGTTGQLTSRCHFLPGLRVHRTDLGGLLSEESTPFTTDADAVQALVDQVRGIDRPIFDGAKDFTNWWVRSSETAEFKLVRSNVVGADGVSRLLQDDGPAAQKLAVFMGVNCPRTFGQ